MSAEPAAVIGLCECGCGQRTKIANYNDARRGERKGEPQRFLKGHNQRGKPAHTRKAEHEYAIDAAGCHVWQLSTDGRYGTAVRDGLLYKAHRLYWEDINGAVPPGFELDHLCGNERCVNPAHLQLVTRREHVRRHAAQKTHCKNGHPYDGVNTRYGPQGWRWCRVCDRERKARRAA